MKRNHLPIYGIPLGLILITVNLVFAETAVKERTTTQSGIVHSEFAHEASVNENNVRHERPSVFSPEVTEKLQKEEVGNTHQAVQPPMPEPVMLEPCGKEKESGKKVWWWNRQKLKTATPEGVTSSVQKDKGKAPEKKKSSQSVAKESSKTNPETKGKAAKSGGKRKDLRAISLRSLFTQTP